LQPAPVADYLPTRLSSDLLTAKDSLGDRIAGLTAGGDDYVTKPFSLEEVIARLRAVIRRSGQGRTDDEQSILRVADLSLNEDSQDRKSTRLNSSHVKSSYA